MGDKVIYNINIKYNKITYNIVNSSTETQN